MNITDGVLIALVSAGLALVGKIIFDWLKVNKNGNGHCAYKTDHDVQLRHNVEEMALLRRIFDNELINQELLRDILEEIRDGKRR